MEENFVTLKRKTSSTNSFNITYQPDFQTFVLEDRARNFGKLDRC